MRPLLRNAPAEEIDKPPVACGDCAVAAEKWRIFAVARPERKGFPAFDGSAHVYRKKTVVTQAQGEDYNEFGIFQQWDGSKTEVYRMDLNGDTWLENAHGGTTTIVYHYDFFGNLTDTTTESVFVSYDPDTESEGGDFRGPGSAVGSPTSTQTQQVQQYQNGSVTTTLSEEYSLSDLRGHAQDLLSEIDLSDLSGSKSDLVVEAFYGGDGPTAHPYDTGSTWASAVSAANSQEATAAGYLLTAQAAELTAASDLAEALTALEAARSAAADAWNDAMDALDDYERAIMAVETWTRREDEAEIAAAEGDRDDAASEWMDARNAWLAALDDLNLAKGVAAGAHAWVASAHEATLDAQADLEFCAFIADEAVSNQGKATGRDQIMIKAGEKISAAKFGAAEGAWREEVDYSTYSSAFTEQVELQRCKWRFALNTRTAWRKSPDSAEATWRMATLTFVADGTGGHLVGDATFSGEQTEERELAEDDDAFELGAERQVDAPESEGVILIVGKEDHGSVSLLLEAKGGAARKTGFHEYQPSGSVPKIYMVETAGGSFAGCPLKSLPAKIYSGKQEYTPRPDVRENYWEAVHEVSFSADVPAEKRTLLPATQPYTDGIGTPIHREFLKPGEILSSISRRWLLPVTCGENELQDLMTLTLSEEFTTTALKALVDPAYAEEFGSFDEAAAEQLPENVAVLFLSPDETYYARQRLRLTLAWNPPENLATYWGAAAESGVATLRRREVTLSTGVMSDVLTQLVSLPSGTSEPITFTPVSGTLIELIDAEVTDVRGWAAPQWMPKCGED